MRRAHAVALLLVALALDACATASTIPGESDRAGGIARASGSRRATTFRADERVVIPSMTVVQAVDVSDRYVFIATPYGLGVYDRRFTQWLPPFTIADGWPNVAITAFMADPADQEAVWVAAENVVYHYRVGDEELMRAFVPQRVSPDGFFVDGRDRSAGVLVKTGYTTYPLPRTVRGVMKSGENSYVRVSPTGFVQPVDAWTVDPVGPRDTVARIVPQTLRSVYARFPTLQDYMRLLTRDATLRSWPVMSGAISPHESEAWIGTAGAGLFRVDPLFTRGDAVPFGLLSEGAGAIGLSAGGVWIGGIGRPGSGRDGLTFADNDLKHWRWIDGGATAPFGGARVTAIAQYGTTVWAATDRGVMRVDNQSGDARFAWDGGGGIPLALAATSDGVWVGTSRGLSFLHEPGANARAPQIDAPVFEGSSVRALVRRGDTLWIGGDAGVLVLTPGATGVRPLRSTSDSRVGQTIVAIATADSVVLVATARDEILAIHAGTGALLESMSSLNSSRSSRIHAIAMDARAIWIAGESGVLVVNRSNGTQRLLSSSPDLAGPAYGVVLTEQYAWIASRDAAVRIRRAADGTVR